jgi:hypothetical protein
MSVEVGEQNPKVRLVNWPPSGEGAFSEPLTQILLARTTDQFSCGASSRPLPEHKNDFLLNTS